MQNIETGPTFPAQLETVEDNSEAALPPPTPGTPEAEMTEEERQHLHEAIAGHPSQVDWRPAETSRPRLRLVEPPTEQA